MKRQAGSDEADVGGAGLEGGLRPEGGAAQAAESSNDTRRG